MRSHRRCLGLGDVGAGHGGRWHRLERLRLPSQPPQADAVHQFYRMVTHGHCHSSSRCHRSGRMRNRQISSISTHLCSFSHFAIAPSCSSTASTHCMRRAVTIMVIVVKHMAMQNQSSRIVTLCAFSQFQVHRHLNGNECSPRPLTRVSRVTASIFSRVSEESTTSFSSANTDEDPSTCCNSRLRKSRTVVSSL